MSHARSSDFIRVKDLALTVSFSDGSRWPSSTPHPQPVLVTCSIAHDVRNAAAGDDLSHSVNYSAVASNIKAVGDAEVFPSIEAFADRIRETHARRFPESGALTLSIARTKALLYGTSFGVEITTIGPNDEPEEETFFLRGLVCYAILGIHPHERQRKQRVCIDVSLTKQRARSVHPPLDYRTLEQQVFDFVGESKYLTVESLASEVAKLILTFAADDKAHATVRISKPSALLTAEASELEVTRSYADVHSDDANLTPDKSLSATPTTAPLSQGQKVATNFAVPSSSPPGSPLRHKAAIAVGANLGDRFANIEYALRLLEAPGADLENWSGEPRVVVVDTSFMYETAPMYVAEQPRFINCACMVETNLDPRSLLTFLKKIENAVGRVESFRNGPRAIDLDIILYDSLVIDTRPESARGTLDNLSGELVVPHPRLSEREFVLRPLADMVPNFTIPTTGKTVQASLAALMSQPSSDPAMYKVIPFPRYPLPNHRGDKRTHHPKMRPVPPTATYWTFPVTSFPSQSKPPPSKTYIMATLNATPDSFSDGSAHYSLPDALSYANSAVSDGANIIDIGGYSTRPGASYVSPEEEFSRVVPVVQAIRGLWQEGAVTTPGGKLPSIAKTAATLISVDTFRWEVAEESVHAGANCINDVYAFSGPDWPATERSAEHFAKMRQVARDLAVPVILMHSRGPASANKDYSQYDYATDEDGRGAVLEGVRVELGAKVNAAVQGRGGIRRWLVIVDPGLGFSKTVEGNLEVLRDSASIVSEYSERLRSLTAPPSRPARNPLAGYPMLIGASRKSFLGAILERPDTVGHYEGRQTRPIERDYATAAAVSCAVQQGATVVRVHDVLRLGDVVRVSSALWS
ncbi:Dihydropteroate synthase [Trametes coccinea BRFM310]|uniref:Dihydropteroate synthase n=1 Tax=Trametes coccinea (strain BRFM310) TaxID=1353009 RepID=A0A1Y2IGW6_TRAC3|nr:Dihydropteroate synthase [Trametes coccinea BRFM310]